MRREQFTLQSKEAEQNLDSLYNKDQVTIGTVKLGNKWKMTGINSSTEEQQSNMLQIMDTEGKLVQMDADDVNLDVINTDKLQLGEKWLFSGVGDAHGNDDWLRIMNKDGTNYYGGVAAGRLYDARIGDLKDLSDGINGASNRLAQIEGVRNAAGCVDGYDLTGSFKAGDIDDCASQCKSRYGPACLCAMRRNDGECWCKSFLGLYRVGDSTFQAKLLPPQPPPPPPPQCSIQ